MEFKANDTRPFDVEDNVGAMPSEKHYESRYANARLRDDWRKAADNVSIRIIANRPEYEAVQHATGVPWQLIGCLHALESSLDMRTWLANGDSLNGPTRNVPEGLTLPGNPPWKWRDAAIKSLKHDKFDTMEFDSLGACLMAAESYNGTGYLTGAGRRTTPPETSPYLWSGTTEYEKGKYVSDGRFDPEAVSQQVGVAAIFKAFEAKGLLLLDKGKTVPVEKKVTWFELHRADKTNAIIGYDGETPVLRVDSTDVDKLTELRKTYPGARSFLVAAAGKAIPAIGPSPSPSPSPTPSPTGESFMLLQKAQNAQGDDGMVPLVLEVFDKFGVSRGGLRVKSGVPGAQVFRTGGQSMSGSFEPLPEGLWSVGNIEFANGKDNYEGSFGVGLGPVWIGVEPTFNTRRGSIGFHRDDNALGTAGCIGLESTDALRKLVQLLREHDPQKLFVDWKLGTCPATPKINNA